MKKKVKKPQGLFSMNDVFNEEHKYDCREIEFGGWESSTLKSRNQGLRWTLFSLPKSDINQPIPIDFKKPYRPTIVKTTNYQISDSNIDEDSFTYSVLMTSPNIDYNSIPRRSNSARPSNRYESLPRNYLYDYSNSGDKDDTIKIKKRPSTATETRKRSPTEILTLNYNSKSQNLNSKKSQHQNLTEKNSQKNDKNNFHICSLNQSINMPQKQPMIRKMKGDDPSHFPFRMSVSFLNEYVKEQKNIETNNKAKKKKSKKNLVKKKYQDLNVLPPTPRSHSSSLTCKKINI